MAQKNQEPRLGSTFQACTLEFLRFLFFYYFSRVSFFFLLILENQLPA